MALLSPLSNLFVSRGRIHFIDDDEPRTRYSERLDNTVPDLEASHAEQRNRESADKLRKRKRSSLGCCLRLKRGRASGS